MIDTVLTIKKIDFLIHRHLVGKLHKVSERIR